MKRFIHNYSVQTPHLRELLHDDKNYIWTEQKHMSKLLTILALNSESYVSYFGNHKETFIYTDASPYRISAILLQKLRN